MFTGNRIMPSVIFPVFNLILSELFPKFNNSDWNLIFIKKLNCILN